MDFIDVVKQFAIRAERLKDQISTEETTKTALIMPFFQQVLGYDVFNPEEFMPEYSVPFGTIKNARVDYAIILNQMLTILIEAKTCGSALNVNHESQLFSYFAAAKAKFAILTNGTLYQFYTDLDDKNMMDKKPFFEFDLLDIKDNMIPNLRRFSKTQFDANEIFSVASELKYSTEIKNYFAMQLENPSDEFVKYILSHAYEGMKTQTVIDKFRPLIKETINNYINELMNERITAAIRQTVDNKTPSATEPTNESDSINDILPASKIVTTEEELEYFYAIKSILRQDVDPSRIYYRDTENYLNVLLDNKNYKWICRVFCNGNQKYIHILDEDKKTSRHNVDNVNGVFELQNELKASLERCLTKTF